MAPSESCETIYVINAQTVRINSSQNSLSVYTAINLQVTPLLLQVCVAGENHFQTGIAVHSEFVQNLFQRNLLNVADL